MTAKHRRPRRSSGRNLAATAAVLTAGALPVAAAGNAFASTAPAAGAALTAAPALTGLPVGLQHLAVPAQDALPLAKTVAGDVADSANSGDLPGTLLGSSGPQEQARDAAIDRRAAIDSAHLAAETTSMTKQLAPMVPATAALGQVAPAMFAGQPTQIAPGLLRGGVIGTFADTASARAMGLADNAAERMRPTTQQLQASGVPTVGTVTSTLSGSRMPVFGTVGGLTSVVPASEMLGGESPVFGAVNAASGL